MEMYFIFVVVFKATISETYSQERMCYIPVPNPLHFKTNYILAAIGCKVVVFKYIFM